MWRRRPALRIYGWRPALQWAATCALLAGVILAVPLLVLATGLVAYPLSFLAQMISVDAGYRFVTAYSNLVRSAFAPEALPTVIPRLITLCFTVAFCIVAVAALRMPPRTDTAGHRHRGTWWGRLLGAPWTAERGLRYFRESLWQVFRGPTTAKEPAPPDLSRRYAELLLENLGQPGFRELIVATVDLETRNDLVFAALGEERRGVFFQRSQGDLVDLAGVGRGQILEALAGAISVPVLTEPHLVTFPTESYWKGETHRTCDRAGAVVRLMDELADAGVEQVILVCADGDRGTPHRLSKSTGSLESRVAEQLTAAETSAVRDAIATHRADFSGIFLIQPAHNPIGPLDFAGRYDERSDRYQSLAELMDRGYEDAYRLFIEPVVGAA
jgi:hypothetical protein